MERIIVKNFGGITELDIELKPINIFIGKQASGKSVTVKLVYFFKSVFASLFRTATDNLDITEWVKELESIFRKYFPEYAWQGLNFTIEYFWDAGSMRISHRNRLSIEVSDSLQVLFRVAQNLTQNAKNIDYPTLPNEVLPEISVYRRFVRMIQSEIGEYAGRSILFVPAGRSFFAQLDDSIYSLIDETRNTLEVFTREFGRFYAGLKPFVLEKQNDEEWYRQAVQQASALLAADYFRQDKQDFLRHSDNRVVEIAHAASGQQELLPLLLVLRSLERVKGNGGGMTLIFEEPEAHIFPSTQRDLVNLMGLFFNKSHQAVQYFITTHSPYILTSFNNLLYAGVLAADERVNKEEVYKIVPQEQILQRGTVAAFEMSGGTAKSIMDEETGMIFAEYLDQVSEETAVQFDNLLDLMPYHE